MRLSGSRLLPGQEQDLRRLMSSMPKAKALRSGRAGHFYEHVPRSGG